MAMEVPLSMSVWKINAGRTFPNSS